MITRKYGYAIFVLFDTNIILSTNVTKNKNKKILTVNFAKIPVTLIYKPPNTNFIKKTF